MTRRQLVEAFAAGAVGGTVLGLVLDAMGLGHGMALGWSPAVVVLIALFGLRMPDAQILLFFVLPIRAGVLVWAEGVIAFLLLLASFELFNADWFGTWVGTVAWWFGRGPAARRRDLVRKAAKVERELRRFDVIEGGRKDEPTRPNRPRDDDDVWH